jgi:hypothetical protein
VGRRESGALQVGSQQDAILHCRCERDRPPEAEPLALPLDLIQPGELYIARLFGYPRSVQQVSQSDSGPRPGTCGLRTPRQLARQGTQGEKFLPAESGADQGGS